MIKKFVLFSSLFFTSFTFSNEIVEINNAQVTEEKQIEDNHPIQIEGEFSEEKESISTQEETAVLEQDSQVDPIKAQLEEKIKNILGEEDFQTHYNLINYITSKNTQYEQVLEELKNNKLIKLDLNGHKFLDLTLVINNSSLKSLKVIKDTFKSLGYYYYLTKELNIKANTIIWNVEVKTEAAIDPLVLSKTLRQRNSFIVDIIKEGENSWIYYVDSENSKLYDTSNLVDNDELVLKKPLKPYLIEIKEDTYGLNVFSRGGNNWHPKVVFYDNELNVLQTINKDRFHRYLRLYVPYNTKYIKIDDLYSLSNIKRGMKITKE